MPEFLAPGVYVEEVPMQSRPIEGVSTSTAGFVGISQYSAAPVAVAGFADFERTIGHDASAFLSAAVRGFFENGGLLCHIALVAATDPLQAGLDALANEKISILCCPDEPDIADAAATIAAHCEARKDRVAILQSTQPKVPASANTAPVQSSYTAFYYPWLTVPGPPGAPAITVPPGGHIAGVYARTNVQSAHEPTVNVPLVGVQGLSDEVSEGESEILILRGINVLRHVPGGIVIWGARTTSPNPEWKYVNVRRLFIFLEQSIDRGLQWAVFEPNGPTLWAAVRATVERFLSTGWKSGALAGQKAEEAYFVRCDQSTMSQADIDAGRFIAIVGVAPLRPAEFVIIRITGQTAPCSA